MTTHNLFPPPPPARRSFRSPFALALSGSACLLVGGGGCVGYNVYPAGPDERGFTNVNDDPFPMLIIQATRWVATRYPPDAATEFTPAAPAGPGNTPFAVNLPAGMSGQLGRRIVEKIGYNAQPIVPGNQHFPIYHVARIWVSGDDAKVDIIRPVLGMSAAQLPTGPASVARVGQPTPPAPGAPPVTQGITVRLRGGVKPWTITSHRVWSFNAMPVPALNYLPEVEPGSSPSPAPSTAPPPATQPSISPGDNWTSPTRTGQSKPPPIPIRADGAFPPPAH